MDFGLATVLYPEEYGYQADIYSPNAPPLDIVQVLQQLHASLDPRTVFACYGKMLEQYLPIQGVRLLSNVHKLTWGKRYGISLKHQLICNGVSLNIQYQLLTPLTPSQSALLQELEPLLQQPLANAILYQEMSTQAMFDSLTGLGNRHYYNQSLKKAIARVHRKQGVISLVVLDLDNFKQLNDKFGHKCGDYILKEFGDVIRNTIRNTDQAFRIGGDEFVVIVQGTIQAASLLCERIVTGTNQHHCFNQFGVSCSLGAAESNDILEAEQLYELADKALYQAKASGRNGYKLG
ncbi:GGDEF domain-containing protein [Shewanella sp. JNE10-2]|uniref:diguanylate cyclase DgcS n=1 Tax=unclassified Shewanella TaxID=196818 RepID=UPI002006259D|nr:MULTISPECIES: GGDEF domain-containing protein [unclassified Shewanella]MCK7628258.1 GGDEF domain-containing protein [Shewanella sp. JNE9-1]MCK7632634.1 GGDEF domain-containing protein [Shewanella sp. JNE17]MCK7643507.1 GGDEF domain-containing protein [Shewanella sp. JNE3-1]MCK7648146.1 GGDEF domain-containing protein [Shewanella sp. JNE8]MCK7651561.1 GGDEF domain-containing protein [Shewanella sp. JNE4-1]